MQSRWSGDGYRSESACAVEWCAILSDLRTLGGGGMPVSVYTQPTLCYCDVGDRNYASAFARATAGGADRTGSLRVYRNTADAASDTNACDGNVSGRL